MGRYFPNYFNLWIVLYVALGSSACAYGLAIIGSTTGQPSFYISLGLAMQGEEGYARTSMLIGAFNGLNSAGAALGSIQSIWTSDHLSRKYTIQIGAAILAVGGGLCAASVNVGMFLAGRFIAGWGIGVLYCVIPVYQSEMSTPETRGFMVCMHGVMIAVGYTLSSWIGFGAYFITASGSKSSFPWRFPIAFQAVPALLLLAGSAKLPFSPRWLVQQNRLDEAKAVLLRLHTPSKVSQDVEHTHHSLAVKEFDQIVRQNELDKEAKLTQKWYELFRTAANRKRAVITLILFWGNQFTGSLIIANYGILIFGSLGIKGYMPLLLLGIWIIISVFGNAFTALYIDRFGRRVFMLTGIAGMFVSLVGECVTQALFVSRESNNVAGKHAAIFFLYLWIVFWSSCQDASQYLYLAEIYPTALRSQGTAFGIFNLFVASIVILVAAPVALNTIGWKFFLVLIIPTFFYWFAVYFLFPETRLRSLEEIGTSFGDVTAIDSVNLDDEKFSNRHISEKSGAVHETTAVDKGNTM